MNTSTQSPVFKRTQRESNDILNIDINALRKQQIQFMKKAFKTSVILFVFLWPFFSLITKSFSNGFVATLISLFLYIIINIFIFGIKHNLKNSGGYSMRRTNPATGLPMVGSVDIHGNVYGTRHRP